MELSEGRVFPELVVEIEELLISESDLLRDEPPLALLQERRSLRGVFSINQGQVTLLGRVQQTSKIWFEGVQTASRAILFSVLKALKFERKTCLRTSLRLSKAPS